jgi:hypothetical protein
MSEEPKITLLPTCEEIDASRKFWAEHNKGIQMPTMFMAEERITEIFNSLPGGTVGFCKTWGYLTFARCLFLNQLYTPEMQPPYSGCKEGPCDCATPKLCRTTAMPQELGAPYGNGATSDDRPDQYCVTRPDGACISEDPRCMHNKAFFKEFDSPVTPRK